MSRYGDREAGLAPRLGERWMMLVSVEQGVYLFQARMAVCTSTVQEKGLQCPVNSWDGETAFGADWKASRSVEEGGLWGGRIVGGG